MSQASFRLDSAVEGVAGAEEVVAGADEIVADAAAAAERGR